MLDLLDEAATRLEGAGVVGALRAVGDWTTTGGKVPDSGFDASCARAAPTVAPPSMIDDAIINSKRFTPGYFRTTRPRQFRIRIIRKFSYLAAFDAALTRTATCKIEIALRAPGRLFAR